MSKLDIIRDSRDFNISSESKDAAARKNEKILQNYYKLLEKIGVNVNDQFRHKPYCCDIKVK